MKGPKNEAIKHKIKANIIIIRHGSTKLNSEDKIRGWMDLPLDAKGRREAKRMGQELKGQDIDGLISSDMKRSIETAEIISEESGIPILDITKDFRPWNVGIHQGKLAEEVLPEMKEYAEKRPNTPIPKGESFNTFKNRFLDGIKEVQKDFSGDTIGIVTHHRGDRVMAAWEKEGMPDDKKIDLKIMFQKGIDPGTWRKEGEEINTISTPD